MGLTLVTPPAAEPVTLDEAKLHCRVDADITADDALLTSLIVAAREQAEHETGRAFVTQTWRLTLDRFPAGAIVLPRAPLASVSSIAYVDADGDMQTLDAGAYQVITDRLLGEVVPVYGGQWPATRCTENAVTVEFVAGYGNAAGVPQAIKQWILLAVGGWYGQREAIAAGQVAELPRAYWHALLDKYRIQRVV